MALPWSALNRSEFSVLMPMDAGNVNKKCRKINTLFTTWKYLGDKMILVSSCLSGVPCRYDGKAKEHERIKLLVESGEAIAVCPECLGGLPTPRTPSEIVGGDGADVLCGRARVMTSDGRDVTEAFLRGAEAVAEIARKNGIEHAILKADSPSCGCGRIYDGSFTGAKCSGDGVAAARLRQCGIRVETKM